MPSSSASSPYSIVLSTTSASPYAQPREASISYARPGLHRNRRPPKSWEKLRAENDGGRCPRKHAVQCWRERNLHGPIPLLARGPNGASQSKSDHVSKRPLHGSVLAWRSILPRRVCQPAIGHWPGEQDHHIRPVHPPLHGTLQLRLLRRPGHQHFSTCATLWTPILPLLSALHQSRRRTRDVLSRSNQSTASPTRPKAAGKGGVVAQQLALAPRKRRSKERATQPTARTDAAVPRTGEDAGTGTTPATAGLSSDNA